MTQFQTNALGEQIYLRIKQEIFDFYLLPHDRFTETQIAERYQVSRTPVRDALCPGSRPAPAGTLAGRLCAALSPSDEKLTFR